MTFSSVAIALQTTHPSVFGPNAPGLGLKGLGLEDEEEWVDWVPSGIQRGRRQTPVALHHREVLMGRGLRGSSWDRACAHCCGQVALSQLAWSFYLSVVFIYRTPKYITINVTLTGS